MLYEGLNKNADARMEAACAVLLHRSSLHVPKRFQRSPEFPFGVAKDAGGGRREKGR
jgi:hypothetical protein